MTRSSPHWAHGLHLFHSFLPYYDPGLSNDLQIWRVPSCLKAFAPEVASARITGFNTTSSFYYSNLTQPTLRNLFLNSSFKIASSLLHRHCHITSFSFFLCIFYYVEFVCLFTGRIQIFTLGVEAPWGQKYCLFALFLTWSHVVSARMYLLNQWVFIVMKKVINMPLKSRVKFSFKFISIQKTKRQKESLKIEKYIWVLSWFYHV